MILLKQFSLIVVGQELLTASSRQEVEAVMQRVGKAQKLSIVAAIVFAFTWVHYTTG